MKSLRSDDLVRSGRRIQWFAAGLTGLLVVLCLGVTGVSANSLIGLVEQATSFGECVADGCLDSEDAYRAHLATSEPEVPWERVRSIAFQNGEVVVELVDDGPPALLASAH